MIKYLIVYHHFCILLFGIFLLLFLIIYKSKLLTNFFKTCIFLTFFPIIFMSFLYIFNNKSIGNTSDWLGFLGGYFGIIGAIWGIWWQLDKEKREKEKEIFESQKNALMSFLHLTQNTAQRYHDYSEAFITLLKNKNDFDYISYKTFEYNKVLYDNLLFKVPSKFQVIILKTMNKFNDFSLKDYLKKSKTNDKEILDFLDEEKKIYKLIKNELKDLILELSKMSDERIFNEAKTKLDLLVNRIEEIEGEGE